MVMHNTKYIRAGAIGVAGILIGVSAIIFGGYDDSPGLQGIGLIICIASVFAAARTARA